MTGSVDKPASVRSLDLQNERINSTNGLVGTAYEFFSRVRSGDLGALPVIIGLAVIWSVFQSLNPVFLSSRNLSNLLFDCSTVGIISLGVVCVLMVAQIDLSVGSVSGFASAVVGGLWVNDGWPLEVAIFVALLSGAVAGYLYATLLNWLGMPSFVSTLAGLLAILGLQLYALGANGSINLPYGSPLVDFGQLLTIPRSLSYVLIVLIGAVTFATGLRTSRRRRRFNLSGPSVRRLVVRTASLTIVLEFVVYYLNRSRGVPWMFAVFVALVVAMNYALKRTKWGRSMAAVGGNPEAARRSGINIGRVYTTAFMLCATLSALGGILSAARLASASLQAGTGDVNLDAIAAAVIGGTSLFGGRGSAYSALLGIIVIQSISNGLTLIDLSSSLRYIITGIVLAIAVIVDSLARKSRMSHGKA